MNRVTHQNIWYVGNSLTNSKPKNAIAQETKHTANEKHSPRTKLVAGNPRKQSHTLSNIIGHSKNGQLHLIVTQNGLEQRGIEWEVVSIASSYLDPNCCSQTHPWWSAPSFQNWPWHFWCHNGMLLMARHPSYYKLYQVVRERGKVWKRRSKIYTRVKRRGWKG